MELYPGVMSVRPHTHAPHLWNRLMMPRRDVDVGKGFFGEWSHQNRQLYLKRNRISLFRVLWIVHVRNFR